ncbi:glycosyltransferase [Pseudorhodoferax sp. Leaf274]|uniref:glycosyltransferase family 2 protein n=1 Tax=Pseudorhodoferax sp. Leaf274 TaxID=1736318 RepID=UPI00070308A3|nr:glycosyltransferase [Pseudorhodoferax sp. Leaf274]KQP35807.1 hypothetical protein ASF44_21105 [Pseudorhodoferax sp. Leaf274]
MVPIYNAEATLARALASVYSQTLLPSEVLCIDDGSRDRSEHVAAAFEHVGGPPLRWLRMASNRGPAAARNHGIDAASQAYIAFLDADDAWHPQKLQLQLHAMQAQQLDLLGSHLCVSRTATWSPPPLPAELPIRTVGLWRAMLSNPYHTSAVVMRRDPAFRFPETGALGEDFALWLHCIAAGWRSAHHPATLSAMFKESFGDAGLSRHLMRMQRGELAALIDIGKHGHPLAAALTIPWSCGKFVRRLLLTWLRKRPL